MIVHVQLITNLEYLLHLFSIILNSGLWAQILNIENEYYIPFKIFIRVFNYNSLSLIVYLNTFYLICHT